MRRDIEQIFQYLRGVARVTLIILVGTQDGRRGKGRAVHVDAAIWFRLLHTARTALYGLEAR